MCDKIGVEAVAGCREPECEIGTDEVADPEFDHGVRIDSSGAKRFLRVHLGDVLVVVLCEPDGAVVFLRCGFWVELIWFALRYRTWSRISRVAFWDRAFNGPFHGRDFVGGQPINLIDKLVDLVFLGLDLALNLLTAGAQF